MESRALEHLKRTANEVIQDPVKFGRMASLIWMTYVALFIGLFVFIWVRT